MTTPSSGPRSRVYDFHGLRLGCSGDESVLVALAARLGRFASDDGEQADLHFHYQIEARSDLASATPDDGRVVYESPMGEVLYSESADRLFITAKWPITAECDPVLGRVTIRVSGSVREHAWALSHPLFTIPLIEMLKRRNRFSVHAAGVAVHGRGILIPGSSGSGKSTLALALARAGFGFLGDDMLFLERGSGRLEALGFPEAFDLTDDTVRLFPELGDLLASERETGWPKRQLRAEDRYGAEIVWRCQPSMLVFPRVAHAEQSHLATLDPGEALLELVPNILLTESASSQRHLEALSELVSSSPCYRLETGTDFADLAAHLRQLLADVPAK
jgi:energy-coupling factor transporter ATP-binding protein EcfA2